ncbi:hypothetical protein P7944_09735, partial [Staphylococcus aureus]|nr:hypothetical protein [Staphylococcus aureus]
KKQKSKTSFTGAFDFLVQKGLMGQPLPIFKYTLAVFNDKEPLHHKSLMVLYQFLPPSHVLYL